MKSALSRRAFLTVPALAQAAPPAIRREVFRASPREGVAVMAYAWYTSARGGSMTSIEQHWTRSDTIDVACIRRSRDHGATWTQPEEMRTGEHTAAGMLRRHPRAGFIDPPTGRYIEFWTEGVLPTDDPLEGMRRWNIFYRMGGVKQQIIHTGAEFNATHPLPGVFTGNNCVMLGDMPFVPLSMPNGRILVPIQMSPLGPDGKLYNPTGAYTYTEVAVLHGRWQDGKLQWEMSQPIKADPARATRGMDEPTVQILNDGRLLMILRGSNDRRPELPSHRWVAFSGDGGRHWTEPQPWTYDDGTSFFSPSACSQLLRHSSGRLFWLGNITPENPRGNRPRYPFVIGEVDRTTGLLLRSTVQIVDTMQAGEDPVLSLSNFHAREDRRTREVIVHMTRLFARPQLWAGDAYLYRVRV